MCINVQIFQRIMASKRSHDDEDDKPSLGDGYAEPVSKKAFEVEGSSSSSTYYSFINFKKAETNHDGSKNDETDSKYDKPKLVDARDLELVGDITPDKVREAQMFMRSFHEEMKRIMNSRDAVNQTLTANFNKCVQMKKTNPLVLYEKLSKVNVDAIPKDGFISFFLPKDGLKQAVWVNVGC